MWKLYKQNLYTLRHVRDFATVEELEEYVNRTMGVQMKFRLYVEAPDGQFLRYATPAE
jgi:phage terminase large subunit-like protein